MRTLLVLLLTTLLANSALAFQSAANHYSLTVPAGWSDLSAQTLEMIDQKFPKQPGQTARIEGGWKLASSPIPKPPLILVSYAPQTVDFEKLPQALAKKQAEAAGKSPMAAPQFQPDKHRVLMEGSFNSPSGPLKVVFYTIVGKAGIVNLQLYAPADDTYAQTSAAFTSLVDSVRFDPGYEYTQAPFAARRAGGSAVILVILLAVGVTAYFLLFKKKKSAA